MTLTEHGALPFEYLIIALGAESHDFDIPGVYERAHRFKTFDDAVAIRNAITFEQIKGNSLVRVVVAGGGPTGVELAAEIKKWACGLYAKKESRCTVTILESGVSVLTGFSQGVVSRVTKRLAALSVHTRCGSAVSQVEPDHVVLANKTIIPFDVFIWTAGVRAVSISHAPPLQSTVRRRIGVTVHGLCIPDDEATHSNGCVYAIGDISCFTHPDSHTPAPQVARAAIEQGSVAAKNIFNSLYGQEMKQPVTHASYVHRLYPYIIPVGGKYAVAHIGPVIIHGFFAWVFKGVVELHYLASIMPLFTALDIWFRGLVVFIKNERLG